MDNWECFTSHTSEHELKPQQTSCCSGCASPVYLDTNWLLMAGRNLCLFCYKGNCHNIRENTQVIQWNDGKLQEKKQTAIFICVVYPGDSLYWTLLVLERFKIVLLPFSNPQFICMPAMCILLEIHVCVLWFLKAIVKVHHKQWPQSSKWKLQCEDEEQVTGSILMAFATVLQTLLLSSNGTQGIPLWPPAKRRSASQSRAPLPQTWHLIWQPSHCTVCD